jgi:hypothetical protein
MSLCLNCGVKMSSEGYIQDPIQLCHACYEVKYTNEKEGK